MAREGPSGVIFHALNRGADRRSCSSTKALVEPVVVALRRIRRRGPRADSAGGLAAGAAGGLAVVGERAADGRGVSVVWRRAAHPAGSRPGGRKPVALLCTWTDFSAPR